MSHYFGTSGLPGEAPAPAGGRQILQFRSLGDCSITCRGRPVDQGLRAKGKALFTLLMIRGDQPVSREWLQNFLWPEFSEQAAANNLRVTLHNLRKVLAAAGAMLPCLESAGPVVKLAGSRHVLWDARTLEQWVITARQCLEAGDRRQAKAAFAGAVQLYRGPFLGVGSLAGYFPMEQRHYHRLAHEAMVRLAALHLEDGNPGEALQMAERAVQMEPLDEAGHMLLMRVHAALGSIQGVVETYNRFTRMLAQELGCTPSAAIRDLFARLTGL